MRENSDYDKHIQELVSQSIHEPTLKTVIVEGDEDRRVYTDVFKQLCSQPPLFLPIRFVNVELPENFPKSMGGGNRARVIQAAKEFASQNANSESISAIVDTDLGFILDKGPEFPGFLRYTDSTCLETFFWSEKVIDRFLKGFCGFERFSGAEILKKIDAPLRELFIMRAAITNIGLELGWIEDPSFLVDEDGDIEFDSDAHLVRLLSKTANLGSIDKVKEEIESITGKVNSVQPHRVIHGHDFISFLRAFLRKTGVNPKLLSKDTSFRAMAVSAKVDDLSEKKFFSELTEKFGG